MIVYGDARKIPLPDDSVQCVVTSPPYWGLRKYAGEQELVWDGREDCEHTFSDESLEINEAVGNWQQAENGRGLATGIPQTRFYGDRNAANKHIRSTIHRATCIRCGAWCGAYGLEPTIKMYVQHTVEILREIWRVLRPDGVVFWNISDSYAHGKPGGGSVFDNGRTDGRVFYEADKARGREKVATLSPGFKPKDLCLIPHRVAIAAQDDGWWVRSDIIWAKPNPMPESCKDRPTNAYEHILMLTKSARYYFDAEAVREPANSGTDLGLLRGRSQDGPGADGDYIAWHAESIRKRQEQGIDSRNGNPSGKRNLRNVWTFPTQPYSGAHFATFPEELPRRCILASSKPGDLVLDPFAGSGTVGRVAIKLQRRAVLLDLAYAHDYAPLAAARTTKVQIEAFV